MPGAEARPPGRPPRGLRAHHRGSLDEPRGPSVRVPPAGPLWGRDAVRERMALQQDLAARFAEGDRKSGAAFLALVLMEEVGELAEAIRRGDRDEARKEVADVAFMAYAIANVLDADLEEAIRAKFLKRTMEDVSKSWTDVPP